MQMSLGVMSGTCVPLKTKLGADATIGAINVGLRWPGGRVLPDGQLVRWSREREVMISKDWGIRVARVRRVERVVIVMGELMK